MQTKLPEPFASSAKGHRAQEIIRSCVHCGFCNATCPTYQILGDELDGPRGRIYLIKEMLQAQQVDRVTVTHLDRCLTCRSCETTCPSGVAYAELLEIGRNYVTENYQRRLLDRLKRKWLLRTVPNVDRFRRWARLGSAFSALLPRRFRQMLPPRTHLRRPPTQVRKPPTQEQATTEESAAADASVGTVALLQGCVQQLATPQVTAALRSLLETRNIAVIEAAGEGCCGALELHLGEESPALETMRATLDALAPVLDEVDAVISTASGCGVTLKDYPRLLAGDDTHADLAVKLREKLYDVGEYLLSLDLTWDKRDDIASVALHVPCTLQHGQKIGNAAQQLLRGAGYEVLETRDGHLCCGSAGTYSILEPALAQDLRDRKLACLEEPQPDVIATSNVGCHSHLATGAQVPVVHWLELLR